MKDFEIGDITPANVKQLKLLIDLTFPVSYSEKFYNDVAYNFDKKYLKFAYWGGFVVGSFAARVDDVVEDDGEKKKKLHIMVLNVLEQYRNRGIATKLLENGLETAKSNNINEVFLHVQINNNEAIKFYEKLGFQRGARIDNYYKDIEEPHAYYYSKTL